MSTQPDWYLKIISLRKEISKIVITKIVYHYWKIKFHKLKF